MEEEKLKYFEKYREIIRDFDNFLETLKTPQPYWFRVNTLKIQEEKLIERLETKGFRVEKFGGINAYRILEMPVKHPGATVEYSLGYYYIQDLSSMAPVLALDPQPGERILDMAAAPGSKSTMIAELMNNSGTIVANDISVDRIKSLAANIERLGITNIIVTKKDARNANFDGKFDKILLDAPCSGEGTFRKNPWGFQGADEKGHSILGRQQKMMLRNAVRHLSDGGIIVYSTCTYSPIENESVVKYGVENLNLKVLKIELSIPHLEGVKEWDGEKYEMYEKCIRIYPHLVDTGGMFIAVLAKQ